MSFKENLQYQMLKQSITQTELAKQVGVSKVSLANYIKGKCFPNLDIAARLSQVLDCSIDYLYFGYSTKYKDQETKDLEGIISLFNLLNNRGKTQLEESIENIASNNKNIDFQQVDQISKVVAKINRI